MAGRNRGIFILILAGIITLGGAVCAQAQVGISLPSIPVGVNATIVPPSQISISWNTATESSGTIAGYYIYRNGGQIATTADTSVIDNGLISGVYIYTVAAYDVNGNVSAQSSPISVTFVTDTISPTAPTSISVSAVTSTNSFYTQVPVTISWGGATDNVGIVGYYLYRNGSLIVTSTLPTSGNSWTDTVTPGTYSYSVAAYDAAQNISPRSAATNITINIDTTPPSKPTNISLQQVSAGSVNLLWGTSTDDSGVVGYQIFRNGIQIASAGGPPYSDSGLSAQTQYSYSITAYDIAGNVSSPSTPLSIMVQNVTGPGIPVPLSAAAVGTSTIKFSWAVSADPLVITGYTIYRNNINIATVTSTNYLDTGLASGTYAYSVSATDVSGSVSATSSPINAYLSGIGAATPTPTPSPVTPAPSPTPSPATPSGSPATTFTQFLYFGLRGGQVPALQSFLAGRGYLSAANATGYFGTLTLHAVQTFQCDQGIVCSGGAGWGNVGRNRCTALNSLSGNTAASTSTSTASLAAQLQALQAMLASLQKQAAH